jgi:hypothetical protein
VKEKSGSSPTLVASNNTDNWCVHNNILVLKSEFKIA